jgi:8-oxo-dGTP pyrophosphatase MutT (NUDIX family)
MPMSPYVRELRALIGPRLLLVPSVSVLLRDDSDRLLLVRQADHGQWGLLGGAIDPGESPRQAAVRESLEEVGLEIELGPVVGALGGTAYEVEYDNGDRVAYVTVVFEGSSAPGEVRPDGEEVVEAQWFARAELATLDLHDFARCALTELGMLSESGSAPPA